MSLETWKPRRKEIISPYQNDRSMTNISRVMKRIRAPGSLTGENKIITCFSTQRTLTEI